MPPAGRFLKKAPQKRSGQKELQPVSSCKHGSPVTRSGNTTMKRTIKAYLTLQATRTAGKDEIRKLSLSKK